LAQKPFPVIATQSPAAEALKKSSTILVSSALLSRRPICTHYTRPNFIYKANFLATPLNASFSAKLPTLANNSKTTADAARRGENAYGRKRVKMIFSLEDGMLFAAEGTEVAEADSSRGDNLADAPNSGVWVRMI
jgi:hypothetical protein